MAGVSASPLLKDGIGMTPKDGPGLVDVLVTILSPVIVVVVMGISIVGYFLLAPWGREN